MGCYLNVYVLMEMSLEPEFGEVLTLTRSKLGEPIEIVKSVVVPNMIFLRFACESREKCFEMKDVIERELANVPWFKAEVVCP